MFRVVCIIEPDLEQILRAKCIRYGMRAPNILATRLRTLYELAHGTLVSLQSKHQLTVTSLINVIKTIYDKQHEAGNEDTVESRTTSSVANHSANKYGTAKIESMFFLNYLFRS